MIGPAQISKAAEQFEASSKAGSPSRANFPLWSRRALRLVAAETCFLLGVMTDHCAGRRAMPSGTTRRRALPLGELWARARRRPSCLRLRRAVA